MVQQDNQRHSAAPGTSKLHQRRVVGRHRAAIGRDPAEVRTYRVLNFVRNDNGDTPDDRLRASLHRHNLRELKDAIDAGANVNARFTTRQTPIVTLCSVSPCWMRFVRTREDVIRRFEFWPSALRCFIRAGVDLDAPCPLHMGRRTNPPPVTTPRAMILDYLRLCRGDDFRERMRTEFNLSDGFFEVYCGVVRNMLELRDN